MESTRCVGKAGLRRQCHGHVALSGRTGHSSAETEAQSSRKNQNHAGRIFAGRIVCAASPSVWFPGWVDFEQQHPIQAQHVYLSLGDKEEHTKNPVMAVVGDNIRSLYSQLTDRGADCVLEWNSGGHFKDTDLRTARAFQWVTEESL